MSRNRQDGSTTTRVDEARAASGRSAGTSSPEQGAGPLGAARLDPAPGRHMRRGRPRQLLRKTLLVACFAAATVAVPRLVAPPDSSSPPIGLAPSPVGPSGPTTPATTPVTTPATPQASSTSLASASPSATHVTFTPISVQAEDPRNLLTGGAAVSACATCDGGYRVRYLCQGCQLIVRTTLPVSGVRTVTVVYESDGLRTLKISINAAKPLIFTVAGQEWTTPLTFHFTAELPAGSLLLAFYNDEGPAPDIDKIVIS
jgi:hypothetical protein